MKLDLEKDRFSYFSALSALSVACFLSIFFVLSLLTQSLLLCALLCFTPPTFLLFLNQRSRKREARIKEQKNLENTVEVLCRLLYSKDQCTLRHTERVMRYAEIIARHAGASPSEIAKIGMAARLHDIGKIFVKEDILRKKTGLTREEFEHVKNHVKLDQIVDPLLKASIPIAEILHIGRLHHERFDGMGYPFGLRGNEVPLEARVISVADAWDAMTTGRIYREGMSEKKAMEILKQGSGTQWDPILVEAFEKAYDNGEIQKIHNRYNIWLVKTQRDTLKRFEKILAFGA